MKNQKRMEERKKTMVEDDFLTEEFQIRRRKKERREKYKVKNQKYHQINFNTEEEFDDLEWN